MEGGLSWATCDHLRNLMFKIFTAAKKWNFFLGQNPALGVELPEKNVVREKHALTPSQILQLLALLKEPCRSMVLLGLLTGLRVGEILGLRWKGIDLISGQLRVEQTIYRGTTSSPKTQGSRRTLPLPQPILQTLLTLYERGLGKSDLDLVFSTSKGTPLSDTNLLHRELKPAGRNDRYSLARLAYAAANSCHVATSGGRFAQGCSSTVRTHETIHYARNLHRADSRTSAGGGRKPGAFGDEW
jgi:integrase